MKSISTKIKLTAVLAVSIAVGVVLYAKADKVSSAENTMTAHSAYTIKSSAATNLNANMKAQARVVEYTSSEYMSKIAPSTTAATDYLAMYDDKEEHQDGYSRRTAPRTHAKPVPVNPRNTTDSVIEGQRAAQTSSATYSAFGVRSVSTRKVSAAEASAIGTATSAAETEEIEEPIRKRAVITVDGSFPRRRVIKRDDTDYAQAIDNAQANDGAYQMKSAPTPVAGKPAQEGYAVRSAEGRDVIAAQQTPTTRATSEGYSRKTAPQGQSNVNQYAQTPATPKAQSEQTYDGYAVRSAGGKDVAEIRQTSTPSGENVGGYAVRTAKTPSTATRSVAATTTTDGYARKIAPQGTGESSTNLAQYDNAQTNDGAYQVKSAPTSASGTTHSGYAVRSAGGKDVAATRQTVAVTAGENFGGYAVRSAGKPSASRNVTAATTTDGYSRKTAPQTSGSGSLQAATTTPARSSDSEYSDYAVRSAGGKDIAATKQTTTTSSDENFGGYAVRSAGTSRSASKNIAAASTTDGYSRKRAPQIGTNEVPVNLAQYDNANSNDKAYQVSSSDENYGGYAVRSAGSKDKKNVQAKASTPTEESFGGYAVRSAGVKKAQPAERTYAQNTTPSTPRRTGAPESTGIKKYGSKGQILGVNTLSANDRSVIVMPKRGRSITGLVVQDDPGRSIIVQSSTGAQSTYRYGEIDALVNL